MELIDNNQSDNLITIGKFTNGLPIVVTKEIYNKTHEDIFNLTDLNLYVPPFPKTRIGKDYDGGYIIALLPYNSYSTILSAGVADDISFEEHFLKLYDNIPCLAFDGTISDIPSNHSNIYYIKKNISSENTPNTTNLNHFFNSYNNIFLKLDIEGHEFSWFLSQSNENMSKISQMVVEFHNPFQSRYKDIFNKINETHYLIHFHPNNACLLNYCNNTIIPVVFECTYLNKKYFSQTPLLNSDNLPCPIDMPNHIDYPILNIDYKPFVH